MEIIRKPLTAAEAGALEVALPVDRHTLVKRRWRGSAVDGREFGFDLDAPLHDGAPFFTSGSATYVIEQQPEPVLQVPLVDPSVSARLGWMIGNLHFSLQVADGAIRVADDSALRQLFERERIEFTEAERVFHPERHAHVH